MTDTPGPGQAQPPKGKRKGIRSGESPYNVDPPPTKPSPTDRIEKAKDAHIEHLDRERQRLLDRVERLQSLVDRLGPENARLEEALGNAMANNVLATILTVVGGGSISFATFVEGASKVVAWVGLATLVSGVLILLFPAFRGRGAKSARSR